MKSHTTLNYVSRLFLLGMFLFLPVMPHRSVIVGQQQSTDNASLCMIKTPDFHGFPNVGINFNLIDQDLKPVTDIDKLTQNLKISEDGKSGQALTNVEKSSEKIGISYYFVVDKGNRSKQEDVQSILNSFISHYFDDKVDDVKIYTDENNASDIYFPKPSSGKTILSQAISEFEIKKADRPYQVINSLTAVLDEIEGSPQSCGKPSVIVVIAGDGALGSIKDAPKLAKLSDRIKTNAIKFSLLHVHHPSDSNPTNGSSFKQEEVEIYKTFTSQIHGDYSTFISADQGGVNAALDQLFLFHQNFTATYSSDSGKDGSHILGASYNGNPVLIAGESSYSISLKPGEIKFNPITVNRKQLTEDSYDKTSEVVQFKVSWPDQYPRKLDLKANLHLKRDDADEKDIPVTLREQSNGMYEFTWNFADAGVSSQQASQHFSLQLEASDQFGNPLAPATSDLTLNTALISPLGTIPPWIVYVLIAIAVVVVLVLVFMVVFVFLLRSKNFNIIERGKQEAVKFAGEVKKTFVGGAASRKKALFKLNVLEGPANMIGEVLPVYTEAVKLGRDDRKADLIFYGMDTNSSVSGLHARIERVGGLWRIIAISESGSQTFVNGEAIPFNEPHELNLGDRIRLGYLARQAVEFEFLLDNGNASKPPASYSRPTAQLEKHKNNNDDIDKTNVVMTTASNESEVDKDKTIVPGKNDIDEDAVANSGINPSEAEKKKLRAEPIENVDDIFEGFRNRK